MSTTDRRRQFQKNTKLSQTHGHSGSMYRDENSLFPQINSQYSAIASNMLRSKSFILDSESKLNDDEGIDGDIEPLASDQRGPSPEGSVVGQEMQRKGTAYFNDEEAKEKNEPSSKAILSQRRMRSGSRSVRDFSHQLIQQSPEPTSKETARRPGTKIAWSPEPSSQSRNSSQHRRKESEDQVVQHTEKKSKNSSGSSSREGSSKRRKTNKKKQRKTSPFKQLDEIMNKNDESSSKSQSLESQKKEEQDEENLSCDSPDRRDTPHQGSRVMTVAGLSLPQLEKGVLEQSNLLGLKQDNNPSHTPQFNLSEALVDRLSSQRENQEHERDSHRDDKLTPPDTFPKIHLSYGVDGKMENKDRSLSMNQIREASPSRPEENEDEEAEKEDQSENDSEDSFNPNTRLAQLFKKKQGEIWQMVQSDDDDEENQKEEDEDEESSSDSDGGLQMNQHSVEFDMDDIESLADADIDHQLLENFFLKGEKKEDAMRRDLLLKHSKIFGYVKISKINLCKQRFDYLQSKSTVFILKKKDLDDEIKFLENEIQQAKDINIFSENKNLTQLQSKLRLAQMRKNALLEEEKAQLNIDDISHIEKDFKIFDFQFCEYMLDQQKSLRASVKKAKKKMEGRKTISEEKQRSRQSIKAEEQMEAVNPFATNKSKILSQREVIAKYTIRQDSTFYQYWHFLTIVNCLYSSLVYPYYTMNGFPEWGFRRQVALVTSEGFFFIDIVINFFKQGVDEGGNTKFESLADTASNYLISKKFLIDLIAFLPFGLFFSLIDERLRFFWVLKAIRIGQLNYYVRDRMLMPIINKMIESKQRQSLEDENKRDDIIEDHIFLQQKIFGSNIIRITRLVFHMMFIAFYIGSYWFIFSKSVHQFADHFDEDVDTFIHYKGNWSFEEMTDMGRVIAAIYFSFTTLSTVGFGDFYPVSNTERCFGSFLLLFGVALFSYIMGELMAMIEKVQHLESEFNQEEQLEKFFLMLRRYNYGQPIEKELVCRISQFLNYKWANDRNNFLLTEDDRAIFSQLPGNVQRQIFTDFIFEEFLRRFRRFFNFKDFNYFDHKEDGRQNVMVQNQNLKLLKKKVNSFLNVRILSKKKKTQKKMSREEIQKMTDHFRKRVAEIERKKERDKKLAAERMKAKNAHKYHLKNKLEYPYLTYKNDKYSQFMTLIMTNLEARFFMRNEMIVKELDECQEILFVTQGRYNVGYEINKQRRYRRQFGPSTIIGGFNMCFAKRHIFIHKAHSPMVCYAIRKANWKGLMEEYPHFYRIIKQKCFTFYFTELYKPLQKYRTKDTESFEQRKDYQQVLAISNQNQQEMHQCMKEIFAEAAKQASKIQDMLVEQAKLWWLVKIIEVKFQVFCQLAFELTQNNEYFQKILWDRILNAIALDKIKFPQLFIRRFTDRIYPVSIQNRFVLQKMKSSVQLQYLKAEKKLKNMSKRNPYKIIKQNKLNQALQGFQTKQMRIRKFQNAPSLQMHQQVLKNLKLGEEQFVAEMNINKKKDYIDFKDSEDDEDRKSYSMSPISQFKSVQLEQQQSAGRNNTYSEAERSPNESRIRDLTIKESSISLRNSKMMELPTVENLGDLSKPARMSITEAGLAQIEIISPVKKNTNIEAIKASLAVIQDVVEEREEEKQEVLEVVQSSCSPKSPASSPTTSKKPQSAPRSRPSPENTINVVSMEELGMRVNSGSLKVQKPPEYNSTPDQSIPISLSQLSQLEFRNINPSNEEEKQSTEQSLKDIIDGIRGFINKSHKRRQRLSNSKLKSAAAEQRHIDLAPVPPPLMPRQKEAEPSKTFDNPDSPTVSSQMPMHHPPEVRVEMEEIDPPIEVPSQGSDGNDLIQLARIASSNTPDTTNSKGGSKKTQKRTIQETNTDLLSLHKLQSHTEDSQNPSDVFPKEVKKTGNKLLNRLNQQLLSLLKRPAQVNYALELESSHQEEFDKASMSAQSAVSRSVKTIQRRQKKEKILRQLQNQKSMQIEFEIKGGVSEKDVNDESFNYKLDNSQDHILPPQVEQPTSSVVTNKRKIPARESSFGLRRQQTAKDPKHHQLTRPEGNTYKIINQNQIIVQCSNNLDNLNEVIESASQTVRKVRKDDLSNSSSSSLGNFFTQHQDGLPPEDPRMNQLSANPSPHFSMAHASEGYKAFESGRLKSQMQVVPTFREIQPGPRSPKKKE